MMKQSLHILFLNCQCRLYNQRYNHPIPEWGQFCQELEELPKFTELAKIYMGEN